MNVVLYLRYSSDRQNEQSIEGQRRICEQYCESNDMKIVAEYIDRATTAVKNIEKREAFQRMINDSEKRKFSAIIVYKLDRFSRNRYDSAVYKNKLKKNGVRVISATEPISDSPEGALLESVLEGMAEFYSRELAQKVTRGMRETALKGNSCGGSIPFGYKIVNKKYEIDTATAPIVQEIFKRYTEGESVADISKDLNTRGIRTPKGNPFNKCSFHRMLNNKKYIGILHYQDIEINDAIPAIIDAETFELAQNRLENNKLAPSKPKADNEYLLTQKLYCGHCESAMIGDSGTGKNGERYYYYTCANRKKAAKNCDKKSIAKHIIEKAVLDDIFDFLTPERIEEIADKAVSQAEQEQETNIKMKNIKAEIKNIEKAIGNLFKLVEQGSQSNMLFERINELEGQKRILEDKLAEEEKDKIFYDRKIIICWLEGCLERYKNETFFHKMLIDMLISSLTVFDNPDGTYTIVAAYNLTSNKTRKFRFSDLKSNGSPKIDKVHRTLSIFTYSLFTIPL